MKAADLQAGGFTAISRGLSAATPPESESDVGSTPAGSQPELLASRWDAISRNVQTGGVASLNPRLIAENPPG